MAGNKFTGTHITAHMYVCMYECMDVFIIYIFVNSLTAPVDYKC